MYYIFVLNEIVHMRTVVDNLMSEHLFCIDLCTDLIFELCLASSIEPKGNWYVLPLLIYPIETDMYGFCVVPSVT